MPIAMRFARGCFIFALAALVQKIANVALVAPGCECPGNRAGANVRSLCSTMIGEPVGSSFSLAPATVAPGNGRARPRCAGPPGWCRLQSVTPPAIVRARGGASLPKVLVLPLITGAIRIRAQQPGPIGMTRAFRPLIECLPLLIALGEPGVAGAVMEDGANDASLQQHPKVLATDRIAPPLVVDDPGILNLLDAIAVWRVDECDGSILCDRDVDRFRLVQGSKLTSA